MSITPQDIKKSKETAESFLREAGIIGRETTTSLVAFEAGGDGLLDVTLSYEGERDVTLTDGQPFRLPKETYRTFTFDRATGEVLRMTDNVLEHEPA